VHEIPDAYLIHSIKGRTRVKIPTRKGNTVYFNYMVDKLSKFDFIEKIEANPLTGSLLVFHTGDFKKIAQKAEENQIFKLKSLKDESKDIFQIASVAVEKINKRIKSFTGGELDIEKIIFICLLIAGIYQIGRGNFIAPAWYTAFWYALHIFLMSKSRKGINEVYQTNT